MTEKRMDSTTAPDGSAQNDVNGHFEVPGSGNRLPVARELGETSLMLLVHPTLTEQNIEDTIRVVKDVICRATK
jgi:dTDP-4-amino-4,6-dideoxygalactose transaminase